MNMEKSASPARMANHGIGHPIVMLKLLGVAALYALLAKIVLTLFAANGVVSIVWPPSGLALAVLLIGGKRYFPGVFLGAFLANAMTGLALGVAAAIAMGNMLEALLGAWLLTRNSRFDSGLRALGDYLRLVVLGGFVACSAAALNGSTTLLVSGFITTGTYFQNLLNWWMGDVLGIVLITPLILAWRRLHDGRFDPKRAAEAMLLLGLMFLANQTVFLGWFHDTGGVFEQVAKGYWMFLFITWVAVRLGICGVVIALVMTAIQALVGAALGMGFFAGDMAQTGLINYWFYIVVLSMVGMALATYFTERERMERVLRESEENLNRAQAVGQIGSWLFDIPTNRLEWSAETYRMFGLPQRKTVDLETFVAAIHPDDRDFVLKAWGEAMAGVPYDIEHRIVVDGQVRWVRERARIERDAKGRSLTGIGTVQDVTELKRIEAALSESGERYRALFEQGAEPVWLVDVQTGVFVDFNTAAHESLGYTREEFARLDIADLEAAESPQEVALHIEKVNAEGCDVFETIHRTRRGELRNILVSVKTITFGGKTYLQSIQRDITERKEYEEELKRSNTDLEQFSYAVSHDMRQPLRMISSYLQLLERSLAGQLDGEKRDYFDFAIEGAKRIDQMLVELLEYSRVGRMGEPPTWIDSRALLDEALQFIQPAIAEAQAKVNIAGEWPRIHASHDEILRLIQNLIGNAIKYRIAGRTPEITVTSETIKNEWCLCVADNGVGIIPDQIKRLFQIFQRLQSREAYEGSGVGLALCRKIAEHHKGRIWVESEGEGKGSQFHVVLPVLRGEDIAVSAKEG
jgi:PAS domain S-box-containing protein